MSEGFAQHDVLWVDSFNVPSEEVLHTMLAAATGNGDLGFDSEILSEPVRLTYRLDFTSESWDLYVDETLVFYDITIHGDELWFSLIYGDDESILLDNNPLFADADNDGMPDWYEAEQSIDPYRPDRNEDANLNGITNFEEYLLSIDSQAISGQGISVSTVVNKSAAKRGYASDVPRRSLFYRLSTVSESRMHSALAENPINQFYACDATGNDGYTGRASAPTGGLDGPKFTINSAIQAAGCGGIVVVQAEGFGYSDSVIRLNGKSLVLRPVGNVVIR